MNGDSAELAARKINKPTNSRVMINGISHHFLFCIKYFHKSLNSSNIS